MSMKIPTLVDILGIENLAAAHGINLLLAGVSGILGPTISSKCYDITPICAYDTSR